MRAGRSIDPKGRGGIELDLDGRKHIGAVRALQAAEDAYRSADPGSARPHIISALELDPTLTRAIELKGMMSLLDGDLVAAVKTMGSVGDKDMGRSEAGTVLTTVRSLGGRLPEDALGSAALIGALGQTFLARDMLAASAICFRSLEVMAGPSWQIMSTLGFIYRQMDQLEVSLEYYDRALGSSGPEDELLFDRALVLVSLGRLEEAASAFRSFSEGPKGSPQSWNDLGAVLEALGRMDEAMEAYDRAIAMDGDYYIALYSKGKLMQKQDRTEEAREVLGRALDLESRVFDMDDIRSSKDRPPEGSVKLKQLMRKPSKGL